MESYNKRWIGILHHLLKRKAVVSGAELALDAGVSSRTIRNDIREINRMLAGHGAGIASEVGAGYILRISDQETFESFLEEAKAAEKVSGWEHIVPSSTEERVWYLTSRLLLSSLNPDDHVDFFELASQLFVSDSTLRRDLRAVGSSLREYGLRVSETRERGLHVVGDESKIRSCISSCVFSGPQGVDRGERPFSKDVFSPHDVELVKGALSQVIVEHDLHLTDIAFENLIVHALIMLQRGRIERHVSYSAHDAEMLQGTPEYACAYEAIALMGREAGCDLTEEALYLCQHLRASQRFLIEDLDDEYRYKHVVERIIVAIHERMGVDLSGDVRLASGLAMHLTAALERLRFEMNIRNDFIDMMKSCYPLAFEFAVIAGTVIERECGLAPNEAEIGFLTMHFGAALERRGMNGDRVHREQASKKRVALVCVTGVAMALLLRERLLSRFGDELDIVESLSIQQVDRALLDSVDMVLTTVDLPEELSSDKVMRISLFPEEDEFRSIERAIGDEATREGVGYRDIFKPELFFSHGAFSTRDEILAFMTDSMVDLGYMDEASKASVFRREEISTTEMGGLLAIPHAMLDEIEHMAVAVMVLDRPITWEKQRVQVVLLLNIPHRYVDVWQRVFKSFYSNMLSNAGVKRLIKHRDYERFLSELEGDASPSVR